MSIAPSAAPLPPPVTSAPQQNTISADVEIHGTVSFKKTLVSHGRITGEVNSTGSLVIGNTGKVEGDIRAATVAVHGSVKGNIKVDERCELRGRAELIGDLEAPRLVIEEGVTFIGNVKVMPRPLDGATPGPVGAPGAPRTLPPAPPSAA